MEQKLNEFSYSKKTQKSNDIDKVSYSEKLTDSTDKQSDPNLNESLGKDLHVELLKEPNDENRRDVNKGIDLFTSHMNILKNCDKVEIENLYIHTKPDYSAVSADELIKILLQDLKFKAGLLMHQNIENLCCDFYILKKYKRFFEILRKDWIDKNINSTLEEGIFHLHGDKEEYYKIILSW